MTDIKSSVKVDGNGGMSPALGEGITLAHNPTSIPTQKLDSFVRVSDREHRLWRDIRFTWSHSGSIPTIETQRYLIEIVEEYGYAGGNPAVEASLTIVKGLLDQNDIEKTKLAWGKLEELIRIISRAHPELRLHLTSVRSPREEMLMKGVSLTHRTALNVLLGICPVSEVVPDVGRVYYPAQLSKTMLSRGKFINTTIQKALSRGWKLVPVENRHFLVPPDQILALITSPNEYDLLAAISAADASKRPLTSNPNLSVIEELAKTLGTISPYRLRLTSGLNAYTYVTDGTYKAHPSETLEPSELIRELGTSSLITVGLGTFLIPNAFLKFSDGPSTAMHVDVAQIIALYNLGLVSVRGDAVSKALGIEEQDTKHITKAALIRVLETGSLDPMEFLKRQIQRWASPSIQPVVKLSQFRWLDNFPEMRDWLAARIEYVEPFDMILLSNCVSAALRESSPTLIDAHMSLIKGTLAEISVRPTIVERYRQMHAQRPSAFLALAPQIFTGDMRQASDAVISEFLESDKTGDLMINILEAWEVSLTQDHNKLLKQMDRTLKERLDKYDIHFKTHEGNARTFPAILPENHEEEIRNIGDPTLSRVIDITRQRLFVQFAAEEWQSEHGLHIAEGYQRTIAVRELMGTARANDMSIEEFAKRLEVEDGAVFQIFHSMTVEESGGRSTMVELAEKTGLSHSTVNRWFKELEELCLFMRWKMIPEDDLIKRSKEGRELKKELAELAFAAQIAIMTPGDFHSRLASLSPQHARIFENLVLAGEGNRKSAKALATEIGIPYQTINKWEKLLEEICAKMKWNVVAKSERSMRGSKATAKLRAITQLLNKAKNGQFSLEEFLDNVRNVDSNIYEIFLNVTSPTGGVRLYLEAISNKCGLKCSSTTQNWERRFTEVCKVRGWPVAEKIHWRTACDKLGRAIKKRGFTKTGRPATAATPAPISSHDKSKSNGEQTGGNLAPIGRHHHDRAAKFIPVQTMISGRGAENFTPYLPVINPAVILPGTMAVQPEIPQFTGPTIGSTFFVGVPFSARLF